MKFTPSDNSIAFADTPVKEGLVSLFKKLGERLSLDREVKVYIAGGIAVNLYTGHRVTHDVDAEFNARIHIPNDLVHTFVQDGQTNTLYFDTNYNSTFALMHENYQEDSVFLGTSNLFQLYVLSPIDLAVSKIARLGAADKEDILALSKLSFFTADELETRANQSLVNFVGGQSLLQL